MRKLLMLLCLAVYNLFCSLNQLDAQVTEYGNFTPEEKLLKKVDFDEEAEAVILFDVAYANYNDDYNLTIDRRIRIKILKQKGIERASIEIPYYNQDNFEAIMNIEATTYTVNGQGVAETRVLQRSDIFRQKINDNYSIVKFALPNVKVGSIVEYKYQDFYKHFGGLDNWYFQTELPTLYSKFFLAVPPRAEFAYSIFKSPDLPIDIDNAKKDGTVTFEMKDVPGLRGEAYMDAAKDYLQHVDFQLSGYVSNAGKVNYLNKWSDVSRELMSENYFGRQLDKSLQNSEEIIQKFAAIPNPDQRIKAVHEYVKNKFIWNGVKTKYADEGIKDLWEKGKGASAEINLLLVKLLKSAGLQAYPILVSERYHGKVSTVYPIMQQFNKNMAYVVEGNRTYVLDATDEWTPYNLIPENVLNTTCFVVDNKKGGIVVLEDKQKFNYNFINIFSTITAAGVMEGEASFVSKDYARLRRYKMFKQDKKKFQTEYFEKALPEIIIDSLSVVNGENDTLPLQTDIKFKMPLTATGDYRMINMNMFSGLEKNPFITETRFSDINFGNQLSTNIIEQFVIPAEFKLEEVPTNFKLIMPDKSILFTRTVSYSDNVIFVEMALKISKPVFNAGEYKLVKEFYKKMYTYLDEPLVLSKK